MPANLTDVSAFTSPVVVPVDTDPADAASVVQGFQPLANRARYLLNATQGAVASGVRYAEIQCAIGGAAATVTVDIAVGTLVVKTANGNAYVPIPKGSVPHGASLVSAHAALSHGTLPTSVDASFKIWRHQVSWSTGADGGAYLNGNVAISAAHATGNQVLNITPSDFPLVHDHTRPLTILCTASDAAGGGGGDIFRAIRIGWTDPAA